MSHLYAHQELWDRGLGGLHSSLAYHQGRSVASTAGQAEWSRHKPSSPFTQCSLINISLQLASCIDPHKEPGKGGQAGRASHCPASDPRLFLGKHFSQVGSLHHLRGEEDPQGLGVTLIFLLCPGFPGLLNPSLTVLGVAQLWRPWCSFNAGVPPLEIK